MSDKVAEAKKAPEPTRVDVRVIRKTFHHNQLMERGDKTYIMLKEGEELPACFEEIKVKKAEEAKTEPKK